MGFGLKLYDRVRRGNAFIRDVTENLKGWQRSIRDPGGFWMGSARYEGTEEDKMHLFLNGLLYEMREADGGRATWEGVIAEMELSVGEMVWRRSIWNVANALRTIYSSIGDNLLTNGGGESGNWTAYNGGAPSQYTGWRTEGTYSIRIVAAAASRGAYIQQGVSVAARTPYDLRVTVNLISGLWLLVVARTDNGQALAEMQTATAGEEVLRLSIPDSNEYAGTVNIWIETVGGAGEIYCDAAVFQRGPIRAETGWYEDAASQAEFGRVEEMLLRAGMTVTAANNEAATRLREKAWPKSLPPDEFEAEFAVELRRSLNVGVGLSLTMMGHFGTMNFRHSLLKGTDEATNHVNALLAGAEFVSAGVIQSNTMQYQIEARAPVKIGDTLVEIAEAGDASGQRWSLGVFEGRRLDYMQTPQELGYRYLRGRLLDAHSGHIDPWRVRPGWVLLEDAPVGPGFPSVYASDNPRWVYANEVEFEAPDKIRFRRGE